MILKLSAWSTGALCILAIAGIVVYRLTGELTLAMLTIQLSVVSIVVIANIAGLNAYRMTRIVSPIALATATATAFANILITIAVVSIFTPTLNSVINIGLAVLIFALTICLVGVVRKKCDLRMPWESFLLLVLVILPITNALIFLAFFASDMRKGFASRK